jgi:hypothetical protein
MAALRAASAPDRPFSTSHTKFTEFTQKYLKIDHFFLQKNTKIKIHKKSTAIFQKSIQMKTHFSSTKAKVYFLGVYKSNPFSQIHRSPDLQILRFYEISFSLTTIMSQCYINQVI